MRTFDRLETVLEERRREGREVAVFFRDGDVDRYEGGLRKLLSIFSRAGVPLHLEIIPGRLSSGAVAALKDQQQRHPDMFEFLQHGWQHVNHEQDGRKFEFGASRSYAQQYDDIARGQDIMRQSFGAAWTPTFTPPWNRCTDETYRAIDQLGFSLFSKTRSQQLVAGYQFREISTTLDWFHWKGGPLMKDPTELCDELLRQLSDLDTVGILLHHKVMDVEAFNKVERLLARLKGHPAIRFPTFSQLATATTAATFLRAPSNA